MVTMTESVNTLLADKVITEAVAKNVLANYA
jgi:hypothetical protein